MRLSVMWLASVLVLAPLVHAQDAKAPGKAASKPAKPITFADDFQTDRRAEYSIDGPVQWQKGRLLLTKGATVRKLLKSGSIAHINLEFTCPTLGQDGQSTRWSFGWEVEDCGTVWVELTRSRNQGKTVTSLRIVNIWSKTTGEGDSARSQQVRKTIRTFSDVAFADLGKLTILYRHGFVRVHSQAKQIAIGYVPNDASPIEAFVVRVTEGKFACRTLALTGAPRPAPRTDQQQTEVAEMRRLVSEMDELKCAGEAAEAVLLGQKTLAIAE